MENGSEATRVAVPVEPAEAIEELWARILGGWRWVAAAAVAGALFGTVVAFLAPAKYRAEAAFIAEQGQGPRLPNSIGALAGQFGVSLGADGSQSPRFYAQLIESRGVLVRLLHVRVQTRSDEQDSVPLLVALEVGGQNAEDSLEQGVKRLRKLVEVRADQRTNIVSLTSEASNPLLAAAIANSLLAELERFNREHRQSQAGRRRVFLEDRVSSASEELGSAEGRLTAFYNENRLFQQSPELRAREAELQRHVQVAQEIYLTLQREFEAARIDEVNDVPVVTVIDRAVPPTRRSFPRTLYFLLAGFAVGLGAGAAFAVSRSKQQFAMTGASPSLRDRASDAHVGDEPRNLSRSR